MSGCNRWFPPGSNELSTYSTNPSYLWLTAFMLCPGMSVADLLLLMRNVDGSIQEKPCYQTAAVQASNPNAPTVVTAGSYASTAGYTQYHETLAITDQLLIRFGVAYKNSSGSALGRALSELTVALRQCAAVIASGATLVQPGMTTTTDINLVPLGDFRACAGLDKLMGAFVVTDNEATYLEYQLAIRTAKDIRAPNSWQTMEAGWSNPAAGNSERNTTLLSIPAGANLTSNMFFQAGLAVRKKSGAAGNPRAGIQAVVAGTYA